MIIMRRVAIVVFTTIFTTLLLAAQGTSDKKEMTYKGYLADKHCGTGFTKSGDAKTADAKAKKHPKDCVLSDDCKASGFGLIFKGKFHKFDDAGDKLALNYLNTTKKEDNLYVQVKGTMDGDAINVTAVKDVKK